MTLVAVVVEMSVYYISFYFFNIAMHSNETSDDRDIFNLAALNGQLSVVQTVNKFRK